MVDDESNQRRKVKFVQILLLMDSFEEEDVLRSRERVIWTRSWIRRREERGAYHQLIRELAVEDAPVFTSDVPVPDDLLASSLILIVPGCDDFFFSVLPGQLLKKYLASGPVMVIFQTMVPQGRVGVIKIDQRALFVVAPFWLRSLN